MSFIFDDYKYKYPSKRHVVYSKDGMVITGNPMAAQAGIDILKKGGNAIDAAIATASVLTVVEPTCNGIGGDSFAIIWSNNELYGMNSSGKSPMKLNAEIIKNLGYNEIPKEGFIPINVPGLVAGWSELNKRFGQLPFNILFDEAINYAENGFIVQPLVAKLWNKEFKRFKNCNNYIFKEWFRVFTIDGQAPVSGDIFYNKDLANTLKEIAATNGKSLYNGALSYEIDQYMKKYGGYLCKEDLNNHNVEFIKPITTNFRGYTIAELPPNGHGITVLMALNILNQINIQLDCNSTEYYHYQIEALKLAYTDVKNYVSDINYMSRDIKELLSCEYAKKRAKLIRKKAIIAPISKPEKSGTVYLATADKYGNMVSYIQSNYTGFGSGIVIPNTGITMHNRGSNFTLNPNSDNYIMPNKKPYHTIIPGFLLKDNNPIGPFGVMGEYMQPQGHLQILLNTIVEGLNPQDALNKPRWQWTGETNIEVEESFNKKIVNDLVNIGHKIIVKEDSSTFGRGEIIWRNEKDVYCGGCEPRTDASIAIW